MVSRLSFATASWTGLRGQKHWQKTGRACRASALCRVRTGLAMTKSSSQKRRPAACSARPSAPRCPLRSLASCRPGRCSSRWPHAPAGCAGCRSSLVRRLRAGPCNRRCRGGSRRCSSSAGNRAPRPAGTRASRARSHTGQDEAARDPRRKRAPKLTL